MGSQAAHRAPVRTGVLLVNLGTPDAPAPRAIRRYLAQFLSDRRVVELPRALWLPLLYLIVLLLRPRGLAHAYGSIWGAEGSPLLAISRRQAAALQPALKERLGGEVVVALAMTYGNPSIGAALAELGALNVRRLLLLPMYPQYSGSTTGAALDALFREFGKLRWPPELHSVNSYHEDEGYIAALAASVRAHWQEQGRGGHLLMSFHGIPQRYVLLGDPYYCQCQKTARLLAEALQLAPAEWSVAFQSRFGKAAWVQPYTDQRVVELAQRGLKTLDVVCPGFAADCLETLEEISLRYAREFADAGGGMLRYIPALNAASLHIDALASIVERHLGANSLSSATPDEVALREQRAATARPGFFGTTQPPPD